MGQRVVKQSFVGNRTIKSGYRISYFWYQDIALDYRPTEKETEQKTTNTANKYSIKKRRREEVFKCRAQVTEAGRAIGSLSR